MFDVIDSAGEACRDAEAEVVARVLAAESWLRAAGPDGPSGAGSVEGRLRAQAAAGEALTRRAQARSLRAVAGLAESLRAEDLSRAGVRGGRVGEFVADQVAVTLGVSRRTAEVRIEDALALTGRLPKTLAALEVGIMSLPVARVLVRETEHTDPVTAGEVEARVLDWLGRGVIEDLGRLPVEEVLFVGGLHPELVAGVAPRATAGAVRSFARRAVADLDADAVREQRERARAGRDVELMPGRPGMVWVGAQVPEATGCAIYHRLDTQARALTRSEDETRTLGQLRADLFTDRLLGGDPSTGGPGAGPGPAVNVAVTIDRTGQVTAGHLGPVTPDTVTDLMALAARTGGRVTTREVVKVACPGVHDGPGRYRPSPALVAAVIARDLTCRFPGCTVPATGCDLDHVNPYPHGPTCICNLCTLCRHHHRLKTFGGWTLTHHGNGHFTWRDPTGTTYDVWPDHPPPRTD